MALHMIVLSLLFSAAAHAACAPFPSSWDTFSSAFRQPQPPRVQSEFETHLVQHKWNNDVSHITAGFLRNSPSERLVRLDYVFDGQLATSLFNFTNTTTVQIPGSNRTITMVDNTQVTASDGLTKKAEFRDYVISNYPLIGPGFLVEHAAVFAGFAKRDLVHERLASWSIMYQGSIPVTVFVDACDVVRGYDYFAPELRTRVVNLFFNTRVGRKGNESRNGLEQGRLGR